MADKWSQFETAPAPTKGDKWSQYETAAPTTKEEPGWFEPGSKSEAVARGLSQGATLGFGDEIQAALRAPFSDQTYSQLRDEQRTQNEAARTKNPGSYLTGNVVSSLPAYAATGGGGLLANAGKTALVSSTSGLGSAEGTAGEQLKQAGTSAAIGAAIPAVGAGFKAAGTGVKNLVGEGKIPFADTYNTVTSFIPKKIADYKLAKAEKSGMSDAPYSDFEKLAIDAAKAQKAVPKPINPILPQTALNAGLGAAGAYITGENPVYGAIGGAVGGNYLKKNGVNTAKAVGSLISKAGEGVGATISNPITKANTVALYNMSQDDARQVKQQYEPRIQEAVAKGQPEYAATFQVLSSSPQYRAAKEVDTTEVDNAADDARTQQAIAEEDTNDNEE
jgi:hypothetical protein